MPSAGEVEQFVYCPHNWWLARTEGDAAPDAGHSGMVGHDALGAVQRTVEREKRDYRDAMRWSFRILAVAASVTFLTLEVLYLRGSNLHWVFLTTALVLVALSAGLLAIGSWNQQEYRRRQKEGGLVPGRLLDSDLMAEAELLEDPAWGLRGRPDYVLRTRHGVVPVEVKTQRTPERPFASHRMQVACYLRLLEARGDAPEYGLVSYPGGTFRVAWDEETKKELRDVLDRMAKAEAEKRADRDHHHVGRCRGCARRSICDQALV